VSVEHIVQDALSPDQTVDVLKRFDGRLRWVSERDEGQSDALNRALAKARGSWIAWLNADEFYLPDALETLFQYGERTGVDVVYGDCVFVDAYGRLNRLAPQHRFSARVLREYGTFISSNAMLMRRTSIGDAPWDPTLKRVMDWDLQLALLSRGARFAHVPYPIGAFRAHSDSVTSKPPDDDHEENVVALRYGLPKDMVAGWKTLRAGRWMHPAYKLVDGAYVRQLRARSFHGRGLRWFSDPAAEETCAALLRRCYGFGIDQADGQTG
jgi:glycosyltransferase involved in cell wall biosynthesis